MTDCEGKELHAGDEVIVINKTCHSGRELYRTTIKRLTEKRAVVWIPSITDYRVEVEGVMPSHYVYKLEE